MKRCSAGVPIRAPVLAPAKDRPTKAKIFGRSRKSRDEIHRPPRRQDRFDEVPAFRPIVDIHLKANVTCA
jgi:hypothetical protein